MKEQRLFLLMMLNRGNDPEPVINILCSRLNGARRVELLKFILDSQKSKIEGHGNYISESNVQLSQKFKFSIIEKLLAEKTILIRFAS